MALLYRIALAVGVGAFGLSVLAGLGYGVVREGGLPRVMEAPSRPGVEQARIRSKLEPRNPFVLAAAGKVLEEAGDAPGALEVFEATLRLSPVPPRVHGRLAGLYLQAGRNAEARQQALLSLRSGYPADAAVLRELGVRTRGR